MCLHNAQFTSPFPTRREVHSLVKPAKSKFDENNNNLEGNDERYEKVRPTASRHLIFIRHGQYNLDGVTDHERYLTNLGRISVHYGCRYDGQVMYLAQNGNGLW